MSMAKKGVHLPIAWPIKFILYFLQRAYLAALLSFITSPTSGATADVADQDRAALDACLASSEAGHGPLESCIGTIQDTCAAAAGVGSDSRTACAAREHAVWDALLNIAYKGLMQQSSESQDGQLRAAQRQWLARRDSRCGLAAAGDPSAAVSRTECLAQETARRTLDLRRMARGEPDPYVVEGRVGSPGAAPAEIAPEHETLLRPAPRGDTSVLLKEPPAWFGIPSITAPLDAKSQAVPAQQPQSLPAEPPPTDTAEVASPPLQSLPAEPPRIDTAEVASPPLQSLPAEPPSVQTALAQPSGPADDLPQPPPRPAEVSPHPQPARPTGAKEALERPTFLEDAKQTPETQAGYLPDQAAPEPPLPIRGLKVTVHNVESDNGKVIIALCINGISKQECTTYSTVIPAAAGAVEGRFENVPPGEYAVVAFHDVNDNNDLDRSGFGIPKEPYAISNDADKMSMIPKFANAAVKIGKGGSFVNLRMHRYGE